MSERLRYEQQLADEWNDLPLPDENAAWADMKRRLDEDDEDPVVPFWLRGCALWGVLGLLLIAGGWWWYSNHNKKENMKQNSEVVLQNNNDNPNQHLENDITIEKKKTTNANQTDTSVNDQQNKSISQATDSTNKTQPSVSSKTIGVNDGINGTTTVTQAAGKIKSSKSKNVVAEKSTVTITHTSASSAKRKNSTSLITKPSIAKKKNDKKFTGVKDVMIDTKASLSPSEKNEQQTDSVKIIAVIKPDTAIVKKDSLSKKSPVIAETKKSPVKKDSTKKNYWYFSTGIAEQQQLPLSGQSFVPFSASGRKGTLADYIPSVYARLHRNEKWFLQAEFRYAAPQYNKELTYISKSVVDTTQTVTKTTQRVKKTYYHQLPFSFNYYVLPNWSVGTGVVFNKFYSAVTVQDILQRRAGTTTDTFLVKNKVASQRNADSNFVNSFFQLLFETQYKYKRFSFGARYTQGLSPYIKLNVPGRPSQEKNKSLQIFLRYELWNSKKK